MNDQDWMQCAIQEAHKAFLCGEVPVGAVIIKDDQIVASAYNRCETNKDPLQHAEMLALQKANALLGSLSGCTMYVTLEPCAMCAGAIVHMRLPRLVFGAFDKETGCCGSRIDLTDHWFDAATETIGGICEQECASLLSDFFTQLRDRKF